MTLTVGILLEPYLSYLKVIMLNFQLGPIGSIFEPHHSLTKLGNKGSFKKNCDECDTGGGLEGSDVTHKKRETYKNKTQYFRLCLS